MRPLIVKSSYYRPGGGRRNGMQAAVAHLKYMANPRKEELVTDAETLREAEADEAAIHAKYMSERPGSQGLFGADPANPPDQAALLKELEHHQGPVWRLFVSVHEDDARAMGGQLMHRQAWEDAARAVLPKMAEEMGIPAESLRWAAAMHRKEGHPHIHLLIWSADPKRGFLGREGLDQSKRAWVSALYGPERERLGKEKSEIRSALGDTFRGALTRSQSDEFARRLATIAESLPGQGRLAYGYMPAEVKAKIDSTVDYVLRTSPELSAMAGRYSEIAAEMASHYSDQPAKIDRARENALSDIRQRLGGAVLRAAAQMDERAAWQEIADEASRAGRGDGSASPELAALVREEVGRLAASLDKEQAREAARRILASPEMAEKVQSLLDKAARRGPAEGAEERVQRARERLETAVAGRLLRSAEYVRDLRRWEASKAYTGIGRALQATIRQAERDAALAEARALEEEAARKRQQAREAEAGAR